MQNSVWFSIGFVLNVQVALHPPINKINYVTISSHRKELEIYSFFCSLVALHKSLKTKYVGLVCGGEIVAIFGIKFTDKVCDNR